MTQNMLLIVEKFLFLVMAILQLLHAGMIGGKFGVCVLPVLMKLMHREIMLPPARRFEDHLKASLIFRAHPLAINLYHLVSLYETL